MLASALFGLVVWRRVWDNCSWHLHRQPTAVQSFWCNKEEAVRGCSGRTGRRAKVRETLFWLWMSTPQMQLKNMNTWRDRCYAPASNWTKYTKIAPFCMPWADDSEGQQSPSKEVQRYAIKGTAILLDTQVSIRAQSRWKIRRRDKLLNVTLRRTISSRVGGVCLSASLSPVARETTSLQHTALNKALIS